MLRFGTQYYRPPTPDMEDWERDLAHIKDLGFNVVKLWAVWNWIERKPGEFYFDDLDRLVAICKEKGIDVIINTIIEGAPYWTDNADYEDSLYETADGEKIHFCGPSNIPTSGWPGLCMDSPQGEKLACNFIEKVAEHFRGEPTVITIDVWNEPHLEPTLDYPERLMCACRHSRAQFISWLKERYGSIENLNSAWIRCYSDWSQVGVPVRFGTAPDMMDWRRFWLYNLQRWLRLRVEAARRGAPEKIIQTHMAFSGYMGPLNHSGLGDVVCDEFLLAKEVDHFGLSMFPLWLLGENHIDEHYINLELIAAASDGKPFYQTELQCGAGRHGLLGGHVPNASNIRQWNWSVIAAGGKGTLYWQYRPETAGLESPGFGMVNINGTDTVRSLEASACAKHFISQFPEDATLVGSENAILISRNSDLYTFAALDEKLYTHSFAGVYFALLERGVPARFLHTDHISKLACGEVSTLYVPMGLSLDEAEKTALYDFVMAGGKLIIESTTGWYDENGKLDKNSIFFEKLFGSVNAGIETVKPDICVSEACLEKAFSGALYRNVFASVDDACDVKVTYSDDVPAVMTRTLGKGQVVLVNGFIGNSFYESRDCATGDFLASNFCAAGYSCLESLEANGMLVRLHETEDNYILVCVNRTDTPKEVSAVFRSNGSVKEIVPADNGLIIKVKKLCR